MAGAEKTTKVVTDGLRRDAKRWDEQAETMLKLHHAMAGLHLSREEAGIFQAMAGSYMRVVDFMSDRSKEGHHRMTEIADALVKSAKAYDDNEAEVTEHIEGSY
jgi:hypothetical protein